MNAYFKKALQVSILLLYGFFCYLLLKITLQYIPVNTDVAFLRIKQDYVHYRHYRLAFFVHVFSSLFVLIAGFTQFSKYIRFKFPQIHRRAGWLYSFITILLAAPSGFIIGIYANGGILSRVAFCLLAVLWIIFTLKAITSIRRKEFHKHKEWMIRSFSLALSAITLRAWKYLIVMIFHTRPMDTYMIVAWLGWVFNLVIAEFIIYKSRKI